MTTSLVDELEWTSAGDSMRAVAATLLLGVQREFAGESSLWGRATGWRIGAQAPALTRLVDDDGQATVVAVYGRVADCRVSVDGGEPVPASLVRISDGPLITVNVGADVHRFSAVLDETGSDPCVWVGEAGDSWRYRVVAARANAGSAASDADGEIRSPMPGSIVVLDRAVGDAVSEGDVVAVVEAMKMENPVRAPFDGVVTQLLVSQGGQVTRNQVLAVVEAS
jgi:acetyl-CoA/propionyl-CoA carboxylase biotin carboxyl carrier protein